ncbi:MAG: AgmX/PglI C-terminal domain-containing protein, partial [Myxococcales bacterium]|nr:AgmX/PglI C-terminal domain-containing protein [Myxococcales bacterium]
PIAADAPDAAPPTGRVDKEAVRSAIQSARPVVADCYQQALAGNAELAGTLTVKFTVVSKDDEGRIRDAEIEGEGIGNPFLEMCVLKALGDTSFPVPDGGGEVVVRYPFKLAPR